MKLSISIFNKNSHGKDLLQSGTASFFYRIFGLGFGYLFTIILAHVYGADALGVFSLSVAVLTIASVLGRMGFETYMLRFVSKYYSLGRTDLIKELYIKTSKIVFFSCLILTVILYILSPIIANYFFGKPHLATYFRIVSFALIPMAMLSLNADSLRGLKKIKEFAFVSDTSIYCISFFLLMISVLFIRSQWIPILVFVISIVISFIISQLFWEKNIRLNETSQKNTFQLISMFSISMPIMLVNLLNLLIGCFDVIMLGILKSDSEVGVYAVAVRLSLLTMITFQAVNSIAAPKFAELYEKGDKEGLKETIRYSTIFAFWSTLPSVIIFFLFPTFVLGIFGDGFKVGKIALMFLVAGQFMCALSGLVLSVLQMTGKQKASQNIIGIATLTNIILNIILIPSFGIDGAAFASMASMFVWNVLSVIYIRIYLKINTCYFFGLAFLKKF